uniref:RNase H type-1 domain-containing protein n=1 Tax=Cajanus cajan TaxID=3821 RepID=A0A151UD13_CAJCA|nr:hypothetical protein KK1_021389 [Cajanus cajan]
MEQPLWSPPEHPWAKLNKDGSWLSDIFAMGMGGVIRDWTGKWRGGFSRGASTGDALRAELLALEDGLSLCWAGGFRKVSCECDVIAWKLLRCFKIGQRQGNTCTNIMMLFAVLSAC